MLRKGGRGLASIQDSVDALIQLLKDYIKKDQSKWNLLTACDWSCLSHLPRQYTGSLSVNVKQQMQQQQQQCWDYLFYTSSGWLKFAYVTNPVPPEIRCITYKLHPQGCSCFCFFSILPALHTQDTFVLVWNFEVGHFAHHFLLLSFFLLVLLWKEFISHSFLCCHI